jgi:GAF domain-containing protein
VSSPQAEPAGEVGIEIAPVLDSASPVAEIGELVDSILRRTCKIARALTGAEQAALNLCLGDDPAQGRKYFSLSEKYAPWRNFRVDPKGTGLHGMAVPPGEVVRLTEDEVLKHPLWQNFGTIAAEHPPMRGWLATSVYGADGHRYGLLQLSDKSEGRDFDEEDEDGIRDLAALIGDVLDWLRGDVTTAVDSDGRQRLRRHHERRLEIARRG